MMSAHAMPLEEIRRPVRGGRQKDPSVETIRGFAIILVIGFHLMNDAELAPARGLYEHLSFSFQNVRIPLFTVVSGYLYGLRPVKLGSARVFFLGKARRLLLPLLVVSSLEYLTTSLAPGINNPTTLGEIWRIYLFPYEHYWFLQALLLVFLIVVVLDVFGKMGTLPAWFATLGLAFLASHLLPLLGNRSDVLSFSGSAHLLPFFVLGVGLGRFPILLQHPWTTWGLPLLLVLGVAVEQLSWYGLLDVDTSKRSLTGTAVGLVWCVSALRFRRTLPPVAVIGGFAYPIYLYTAFGSGLGRRLAEGFPPHAYLASVTAITVIFGIAVAVVLGRVPYVRALFLGLRARAASRPPTIDMKAHLRSIGSGKGASGDR